MQLWILHFNWMEIIPTYDQQTYLTFLFIKPTIYYVYVTTFPN